MTSNSDSRTSGVLGLVDNIPSPVPRGCLGRGYGMWQEANRLSQSAVADVLGKERSRSQIVILKRGHNVKFLPYAFTEQGVACSPAS